MRKSTLFFVVGCFLVISSCKQELSHDESLTLSKYKSYGMPDPDKVWESNDFSLAYAVLEDIKSTKPYSLPIASSRKSSMVFNKLVSLENLNFLSDRTLPNEQKLKLTTDFLKVCENWIRLYHLNGNKPQYYHTELSVIYLFGLELTQIMVSLNDQDYLEGKIEDSENEMDQVHSFYFSGLFNLLSFQSQASQLSENDHILISGKIVTSVDQNKSWMDDATRNELKQILQTVSDSTANQQIDVGYSELIDSL